VAKKTAPDVTGAIQRIDYLVDAFGGCSAELLDFASGVVAYIEANWPEVDDSARFRIACYLYDVTAGHDALASAAGYAVAAWRLAGPIRHD
jgi:hypothetical protein